MPDSAYLKTTPEFGLIDHINALDKRVGHLEMLAGLAPDHEKFEQGSGSEKYGVSDWTQTEGAGLTDNTSPSGDPAVEIAGGNQTAEEMTND